MDYPNLDKYLNSRYLRVVLQSKELAQLGDFLTNFIYSTVRVAIKGVYGGVHVWDSSLRDAMVQADLRNVLGKRTKPDKVADAGEALIAYSYYTGLMNMDEYLEFISLRMDVERLNGRIMEKEMCAEIFAALFQHINELANNEARFLPENN